MEETREGTRGPAAVLRAEADLFNAFDEGQEALLRSIVARAWTELEGHLASLGRIQREIQQTEAERRRTFEGLAGSKAGKGGEAEIIEAVLDGMEASERVELEGAYHTLKIAVLRAQGSLMRLDHYVSTVSSTLQSLLGELLPHRKGRIYSSRGGTAPTRDEALVVDRRL